MRLCDAIHPKEGYICHIKVTGKINCVDDSIEGSGHVATELTGSFMRQAVTFDNPSNADGHDGRITNGLDDDSSPGSIAHPLLRPECAEAKQQNGNAGEGDCPGIYDAIGGPDLCIQLIS